ncbi:hypothetical protein M1146_06010 [Patescibacteria group bacterium]|nr:hypothetical protein [Patescibacteria group bacterium]
MQTEPQKTYPIYYSVPRLAIFAGDGEEFRDCVLAKNLFYRVPLWLDSANDCLRLWKIYPTYELWLVGNYKKHPLWGTPGFKDVIEKATKTEVFGKFPKAAEWDRVPISIELLRMLEGQ